MTRPAIGFKIVRQENPRLKAVWDGKPKRSPRKGELYLSGCAGHEVAYEAKADLDTPYFIATPC